jgi:hypothetical protein
MDRETGFSHGRDRCVPDHVAKMSTRHWVLPMERICNLPLKALGAPELPPKFSLPQVT